MKLLDKENVSVLIMLLLAIAFVCMVAAPAWSDDRHHHDDDSDVTVETVLTAGDNTSSNSTHIDGGRTLAFSNSLGDVSIAGCLGSTQWSTPLFAKQKLSVNWACLAEFYLRAERWDLAAMAMCNTEIRKEFASEDECRVAHDFTPLPTVPTEHLQEDAEYHEQYEQQFVEQMSMIQELRAQIERPAIPKTVVQKTEFIDEKKRAQLESLRSQP